MEHCINNTKKKNNELWKSVIPLGISVHNDYGD